MKGGLGSAAIAVPGGLVVAALAAVNAVGDVIDPATGRVVAGVRTPDGGGLADARTLLRAGTGGGRPRENTTLGVVATNAALTQAEATTVAQMAHDGFARAIVPSHTPNDGDAIFALATGRHDEPARVGTVGALAAEAMAEAVVRAVRAATGIPGYPAARDLASRPDP
jgi:L-aminopeptidase/D-esterase-like protein